MNYFELFDLPVSFNIDKKYLRKKYIELSRASHPDYFISDNEEVKKDTLEFSAVLNKAYKTLGNPDETIKYLLKEKGIIEDDEKYVLSPEFLMEMMELNEELAETEFSGDKASSERVSMTLVNIENEIYKPVQFIIENYKDGITSEQELMVLKDYYFRKKYLQRLRDQLDQKS
jgi:molecular chaperone HscB